MEALDIAAARVEAAEEGAGEPLVSVVIPCLDEAESVAACVTRACRALAEQGLNGEVVVSDNGSSDGSAALAVAAGARVVREPRRGYGSAYLAGFAAARGRYIVMADADGTYDLADVGRFVERLEGGADLVVGSRVRGTIHPGAMPWLHRRIGNPLLTAILNLFFRTRLSDAHCGMRAFRRSQLPRLALEATGMEFASEQLIRSSKLGLAIEEIPIEYRPRAGRSKLSSFPDGWRHLRLLLVHSPTWLFLVPGACLVLAGLLAAGVVLAEIPLFGRQWQLHTLIAAAMLAIVGSQLLQFGVFARSYAVWHLGERDALFERVRRRLRLETVLLAGAAIFAVGAILAGIVVGTWLERGFGDLREEKLAVAGLTLVVIGIQIVFGGFLLSVLGLRRRHAEVRPGGDD